MKLLAIIPIKIYQYCISPLIGTSCRFYPSCSEYAAQAVTKHGLLKGCCLAAKRICKCGPWHPGGPDEP